MKFWAALPALFAIAIGLLAAQSPSQAKATDYYNCVNFSSQEQAQEFLFLGDPHNLDPDKDGIACNGLPCPCVAAPGGGNEGATRGDALPTRAAERISKSLVAGLTRRSSQLQSWSFSSCQRVTQAVVDCVLGAQGESIERRLACRYRVAVQARKLRLAGRITGHDCHTVPLLHLTFKRAKRALEPAVRAAAGPESQIVQLALTRDDRLTIAAETGWIVPRDRATNRPEELCQLTLSAKLRPKQGDLRVTLSIPLCTGP